MPIHHYHNVHVQDSDVLVIMIETMSLERHLLMSTF